MRCSSKWSQLNPKLLIEIGNSNFEALQVLATSDLNLKITRVVAESAKVTMLVLSKNGEQRLITFTWPDEPCSLAELLDQAAIQVGADCKIEVTEMSHRDFDFIVKLEDDLKE